MAPDPKNSRILAAFNRLVLQHGYKKVTMTDIAAAAEMSRPTLYASFPTKEAVLEAMVAAHTEQVEATMKAALPRAKTLEAQLTTIFEHLIVTPFASVVDLPNGVDLMGSAASFAPEAYAALYARFEGHLIGALSPVMKGKRGMSARDLAHIVMLATRGLKATTATLSELQRMTRGLIAMAVATANAPPPGTG